MSVSKYPTLDSRHCHIIKYVENVFSWLYSFILHWQLHIADLFLFDKPCSVDVFNDAMDARISMQIQKVKVKSKRLKVYSPDQKRVIPSILAVPRAVNTIISPRYDMFQIHTQRFR